MENVDKFRVFMLIMCITTKNNRIITLDMCITLWIICISMAGLVIDINRSLWTLGWIWFELVDQSNKVKMMPILALRRGCIISTFPCEAVRTP